MTVNNEDRAVARLSELLALERGYPPAKAGQIKTAAALHDVGKQKIPKEIIFKPGKLTAPEFALMKTHTKIGAEMLSTIAGELGNIVRTVCELHHEWVNGGGYWGVPTGDLPEYVSIVSMSDVFVACRFPRPYKPAWTVQAALEYIQSQAGTQFSLELTEVFTSLIQNDSRVPAIFYGVD